MKISEIDIDKLIEHAVGNAGSVVILLIVFAVVALFAWKIGGAILALVANKLDEFKELKDIVKGFAQDVKDVLVKFTNIEHKVENFTDKFNQLTEDVKEFREENKEERKEMQQLVYEHSAKIARIEERVNSLSKNSN